MISDWRLREELELAPLLWSFGEVSSLALCLASEPHSLQVLPWLLLVNFHWWPSLLLPRLLNFDRLVLARC